MADLEFVNLGAGDYERAKTILNKARHPGFVGRELFYRCATTGVVCVATLDGIDLGVAMIAKEKLQALSIIAAGQGKGVGTALMRRLQPRWVSSIADRVSFFERCGYKPFGAPKVGQNGKHATQLMERGEVLSAPESVTTGGEVPSAPRPSPKDEPPEPPFTLLVDLAAESQEGRIVAKLQLLDDLLKSAIANDKAADVLKILESAEYQHNCLDQLRRRNGQD